MQERRGSKADWRAMTRELPRGELAEFGEQRAEEGVGGWFAFVSNHRPSQSETGFAFQVRPPLDQSILKYTLP